MNTFDAIVVGGGLVGSAIAFGLARQGLRAALLDEGDAAFRASRGNFALVWVQGKGLGMPRYARWTRLSADLWPEFARELHDRTGVDVVYEKPGGIKTCLGEQEFEERRSLLERLKAAAEPPAIDFEMLDRKALEDMLPPLGPEVVGGSYSPHDGHCNSLFLLRALHRAFTDLGGTYFADHRVTDITRLGDGAAVTAGNEVFHAPRTVIAAGNACAWLAPLVGLDVPVKPEKGQIIVTERTRPLFRYPTHLIRQSGEGTLMFGDSHEDVGFDDRSRMGPLHAIAAYAVRTYPMLKDLKVVRSWGCLRIMPTDGFAIYDHSDVVPGAFTAGCHSGVTLAAVHALKLAPWIAEGALDDLVAPFSAARFQMREAA